MPPTTNAEERRLSRIETDLVAHAGTLTSYNEEIAALKQTVAVLLAENKFRDEKIGWLYKVMWAIAAAIISGFVGLGFAFINGKINVG